MELTLHRPENHHFIRSVTDTGFQVNEVEYEGAIILSAETVIPSWAAASIKALTDTLLQPVFELQPEIVLLGTGRKQIFPKPALLMSFYRRGIGIEAMTTHAACRTFNVLMSEKRKAVAAMLPAGA
jgi:uncharacterized protein